MRQLELSICVYDLIYNPEETVFLQKSKAMGAIYKKWIRDAYFTSRAFMGDMERIVY
jgi:hypothetical protein